ncbi:hypothetical protein L484_023389 [Morus notabilis]|uniref:Uncharacterized protein n=1 Tax=Morus notabilis TaxID=981085 RepID=W9S5K4_9ROSA|nr:hypothetical protein L484_023389 [Morus notabilis]
MCRLQKPSKRMKEREDHWRERGCLDHATARKGTSISRWKRKWELISRNDGKGATQSQDGDEMGGTISRRRETRECTLFMGGRMEGVPKLGGGLHYVILCHAPQPGSVTWRSIRS